MAKVYQADALEQFKSVVVHKRVLGISSSHKPRMIQMWLEGNVPDFIITEEWSLSSTDLNPLGYDIWSRLEDIVFSKGQTNLFSLKEFLTEALVNLDIEAVGYFIDALPHNLRACIKANGEKFE